jgi:uncharacterized membrane protein YeaQ/YmgE (transglycosylase-associated protein family)
MGGTMETLLVTLVIGAVAGWLAGIIVQGTGFGLIGDILVGIAGAFVAGFLFPALGIGFTIVGGVLGAIIVAALGAIVLLLVVGLIRKLVS